MTSTLPTPMLVPTPMRFGVATASFQVEGATTADGRGRSIWDVFCEQPGTIADGSDGSVACGSYDRLEDDLALVAGLGVDSYRFSLAWPRVQPDGRGAPHPSGLDYYDRLVDGLLAMGVQPLPTLYHWDLPQALQDAGGWPARDTALRLADYAAVVAARLGDRVTTWATLNEPWCSAFLGHAAGVHAPGWRDGAAAFAAAHHLLLGHALAAQAVRAAAPGADVGVVLNPAPVRPEPGASPLAVAVVDAVQNGLWLNALLEGRYPEVLPALADPALVQDGDLALVRGSASWLGVNYYTPLRVGPYVGDTGGSGQDTDAFPGAPDFSFVPRTPVTAMGWEVDATGMIDLLLSIAARARPAAPGDRERRGVRRPAAERGRRGPGRGPHVLPARPRGCGRAGARAGRAGRRARRVDAARQRRVGPGLLQAVRHRRGRARDAAPGPQGVLPVVRRARAGSAGGQAPDLDGRGVALDQRRAALGGQRVGGSLRRAARPAPPGGAGVGRLVGGRRRAATGRRSGAGMPVLEPSDGRRLSA